jgi:2-polyprenyl-6-methoxyphenol hydroxylase-like FAD-dependent oxidoreductase
MPFESGVAPADGVATALQDASAVAKVHASTGVNSGRSYLDRAYLTQYLVTVYADVAAAVGLAQSGAPSSAKATDGRQPRL